MNIISSKAVYRGAFGLAAAVIAGAFGAHYLKDKLTSDNLQIFETAVRYQFYGCFGLILLGLTGEITGTDLKWPVHLLRFGILIFCGTVYFLALRPILHIDGFGWVGAITPIGGLCMIAAWIWTGWVFFKIK